MIELWEGALTRIYCVTMLGIAALACALMGYNREGGVCLFLMLLGLFAMFALSRA